MRGTHHGDIGHDRVGLEHHVRAVYAHGLAMLVRGHAGAETAIQHILRRRKVGQWNAAPVVVGKAKEDIAFNGSVCRVCDQILVLKIFSKFVIRFWCSKYSAQRLGTLTR